ncbi:helix-turn-helix domain-containing protein [Streptomyces sp. W16]|uniref:nSTAND1 domain-containing NTPase n=1 Tax=Streptomyces sp. W16 TaxID=3076631 RepID=UPI00295AFB01|nr:helix-turn-helix domain-containing protein [Streptomyces sp. W16]MDV9173934.1 helix-turn-helix domain-containing protein [Streptomyces sp. W16]
MGIEYGEGASDADEPDDRTFGTELRRRRGLEGLSLTRLAALIHYSRGHISRVENGEKRPSEKFARACDQVLRAKGELLALAAGPGPGECPYPGLTSFRTEDARWFFGRDRPLCELLNLLGDSAAAGHPLMVVGASGVGKSSLLRAGLAPAVPRGVLPARHPGTPEVLHLSPTSRPLAELRRHDTARPLDSYALVIVDQFEEVFTLCADANERNAFIDQVCRLAGKGLPVVISMRADFYGYALAHPSLLTALRARSMPLGPMTADELRSVIAEPAAAAGLALEPGLTEILLRDLGPGTGTDPADDPACGVGALPLLSHALRATWQQRSDGVLTVAGYERTGGIRGAVATTAERAYGQLTEDEQLIARRLLLSLVRVGDGVEDTRRRARRESLAPATDPAAVAVVERFTSARLLTADTEHVEISHEALLKAWPRLRGWIDADRTALRLRQQLTDAATAWAAEGRDAALLYRGTRLTAAEEWAATHPEQTSPTEADFLRTARRHQQRGVRRLRRLVATLAVITVVALTATFLAVVKGHEAEDQRDVALSSGLAAQADLLQTTDPALGLLLGRAALRAHDTEAARSAVLSSSAIPYATRFLGDGQVSQAAAMSPDGTAVASGTLRGTVNLWSTAVGHRAEPPHVLQGSGAAVTRIAFDRRRILAAATANGPVRLWDAHDPGHPLPLDPLPDQTTKVSAMAFSHDGHTLVTGDASGHLALWDMSGPRHPVRLVHWQGHTGAVNFLALSRDGTTLATAGRDSTARLWKLAGRRHPRLGGTVPDVGVNYSPVTLSADGRTLFYAQYDVVRCIRSADLDTDGRVLRRRTLFDLTGPVSDLALSPDGRTLAAGSIESELRLFDLAGSGEPLALAQTGRVVSVAFGPDSRSFAVGSGDGSIQLWTRLPRLAGHHDVISRFQLSSDRKLGVTASADETAGIWDLSHPADPVLRGRARCGGRHILGAAFSPDSRLLALTTYGLGKGKNYETPICLWNIADSGPPRRAGHMTANGHSSVNCAAFSNDGHTLVTGGNGGNLVVWDVENPSAPRRLQDFSDYRFYAVMNCLFLPHSDTLAIGTYAAGVELWKVTPHHPARRIAALPDPPQTASLAVDQDGTLLAAGGTDHRIHLWDITDPANPRPRLPLSGHTATVSMVDFSPDTSRRLITSTGASTDPVRLWDLTSPQRPRLIGRFHGPLGLGAFAHDGTTALITTTGRRVQPWQTDATAFSRQICQLAGTPMTSQETSLYPMHPYRPPCVGTQ